MALLTTYCSAAELKHLLRIETLDTSDDAEIALAIEAASRAIDLATNRQFGVDAAPVARYYDPPPAGIKFLLVDDISTVTGLTVKVDRNDDGVFEETLTISTDFRLWPWNAAADSRPWEYVVLRTGFTWPTHERSVEVTAAFGWLSVPTAIKQAALIQANRFFKRRDAAFGVAGSPELGSELRLLQKLDPDVAVIVQPYKKWWAIA